MPYKSVWCQQISMAKAKSKKQFTNSKWKPVEIKGSLLEGDHDFSGLAGLEVLENYDPALLKNTKKSVSVRKYIGE